MAINLKSVDKIIDDLMVDEVLIERDNDDATGTFDTGTGTYSSTESHLLYEGPAMISNAGTEERMVVVGGEERDETTYTVRIPADEDIPRITKKDRVVVVRCDRSPQIEGRTLIVHQEMHGTYQVGRKIQAVLLDSQVD